MRTKSLLAAALGAALVAASAVPVAAQDCAFRAWTEHRGTPLLRTPDAAAYMFRAGALDIVANGAPAAYSPDGRGLDDPAKAGWSGPDSSGWQGRLVADPRDPVRPLRQDRGKTEGFFVSTTRLQDPRRRETDPRKYADAARIPYITFPRAHYQRRGTGLFGDLGVAIAANGKMTGFVVADQAAGDAALGGVSIALAEALSGKSADARRDRGGPEGPVTFVVFPYSARDRISLWPMAPEEITELAFKSLELLGGKEAVIACN
ncbi:hypothetical protein ACQ5SO_15235 [Rhodovulum sp. DZ06]|uniref:hypothetical protein n=1 Tax=Rhodovulum sp. DZ06 TaxID=3425126 RepID=UPI003D339ADC